MAKLRPREYRRRVFNKVLVECFFRINMAVLDECTENGEIDHHLVELSHNMCEAFLNDELKLKTNTVAATRQMLSEASNFIQDCAEASEEIADAKAQTAEEEGVEMEEEQEIQLSQEDQAVIDQLFDIKKPVQEIESIRDATVSALIAEDKKAQEIKDAYDIAKSQVVQIIRVIVVGVHIRRILQDYRLHHGDG